MGTVLKGICNPAALFILFLYIFQKTGRHDIPLKKLQSAWARKQRQSKEKADKREERRFTMLCQGTGGGPAFPIPEQSDGNDIDDEADVTGLHPSRNELSFLTLPDGSKFFTPVSTTTTNETFPEAGPSCALSPCIPPGTLLDTEINIDQLVEEEEEEFSLQALLGTVKLSIAI